MRYGAALLGLVALGTGRLARADEVDDLVAKGQDLAKRNEYTQAISAFKQADAKRPRAAHACMIGLAYMRREAWPQAELFLALCEKRAAPGDQPPDWTDAAEKQLADKLRAAQIPAITIEVTPANIGARLTVSSFAPDEQFDPRTIHLAPGKHVIEVTAPGFHTVSRDVEVKAGEPQKIEITLERDEAVNLPPPTTGTTGPTPPVGPPVVTPAHPDASKVPWIVGGAGVALAIIGVAYDAGVVGPARDKVTGAETDIAGQYYLDDFHSKRNVAIGIYAGAAITIGVAAVLHFTVYKDAPQVTAQIDDHGGAVLVGWRR